MRRSNRSVTICRGPPRSWPSAEKLRFKQLPYDLQIYMHTRESWRDKEVRRAQNEAALAKQELEAMKQPTKDENGNLESQTTASDAAA